jgi:transcriptional regulator with XRE-family HTH domain
MNREDNLIGRRLSELRESKGITQGTVAKLLNLSNKTISKWENESSSPDLKYIPILADYFEVSIDELFGKAPYKKLGIKDSIRTYLSSYNAADSMVKAFELTNDIFLGCIKNYSNKDDESENQNDYPIPGRVISSNKTCTRNLNTGPTGFQFIVNSEELNMAIFHPGNADNFQTIMNDAEKYQPLLHFLAKEHSIKLLSLLYQKSFPTSFTADYISKKAQIDLKATCSLLDEAVETGICKKSIASLNEGTVEIFDFLGIGMILVLIALAYEYSCGTSVHFYRHNKPNKMIKEIAK